MNTLIAFLTAFILANSDLPETPVEPVVQFQTGEALWHMQHPGSVYKPEDQRLKALYGNDFIYLRDDFTPSSLVDVSALMHELVHHHQAYSDKTYECHGAKEAEAYGLQFEFLERVGNLTEEEIFEQMQMNALYLHFLVRCPIGSMFR